MRKVQATLAFAAFCFVSWPVETHADVSTTFDIPGYHNNPTKGIYVHGFIRPSDVDQVETLLREKPSITIALNSTGGDVMAAMAMGRILRREGITAFLFQGHTCMSACVLVLAGAPQRVIGGTVGIHRPFLTRDDATTAEQQKEQYKGIERLVKSYFAEMNVDPRLYDDMFRISPSNAKLLSKNEQQAYGLVGTDPYIEQAGLARDAKNLDISTQELLRRRAEAEATCGETRPDAWKCRWAIELGIPRKEFDRRVALSNKVCDLLPRGFERNSCDERIMHGSEK